jgi:hypothetical protein
VVSRHEIRDVPAQKAMPAFFFLDLHDTRRRAALLISAVTHRQPTSAWLKRDYARTLVQLGKAPLNSSGQPRVVSGGGILRIANARRLVRGALPPSRYSADSRLFAIRRVEHSLLLLRQLHPGLRELCDLLITDILVWPSVQAGGGSASNLLGVAWLVPSGNLTSFDVAESVVHEMVHLNLHLADMTFGLYTRAPGSDFEAHSAVLGRRRPYHHAFHSACVAVAMIYFRMLVGLPGEITPLRASLRRCTSELLAHRAAFTVYSWRALHAAHAFSIEPRLQAIPVHRDLRRLR